MPDEVNTQLLAGMVRRRVAQAPNLRAAAEEAGVSPATLSRVQRGHGPDLDALVALARWLKTPVERLLNNPPPSVAARRSHTVEKVEVYLRADPNLSPETASRVTDIFRAVYEQFTADESQGE